ncbi:MAG: DNA-processing protein DprA [bacterium]
MNELSYSILRLLNVKNIGNSKAFKLIQNLKNKGVSLVDLIKAIDNNESFGSIKESLNEEIYNALKSNKNSIDKYIEILKSKNIKIVNRFDENYPAKLIKRLEDKTPLILFALGNYDLINDTSVGFCGSRDASQKGLEAIEAIIGSISDRLVYTSGYAKGVDIKVHKESLEKGFKTIIVLPEGILNFKVKKEIKNIFNWDNILVLSEFMPDSKWSVANAMQRNSIIVALSNVMILIEAKEYGGSFNAGQKALELGVPLYIPKYDNSNSDHIKGNIILAKKGAKSFYKSKSTNEPKLEGLFNDLKAPKDISNYSLPVIEQKSLFN